MAATYDSSKLKDRGKDRMRFDIGDTNTADPLLQDEEIALIIEENADSWNRAKYILVQTIADRFAPELDVQGLGLDLQARAKFWADKAASLKRIVVAGAVPIVAPTAGGAGDETGPYFQTGGMNNRG